MSGTATKGGGASRDRTARDWRSEGVVLSSTARTTAYPLNRPVETLPTKSTYERWGFLVCADVLADAELEGVRTECDRLLGESPERGGVRNVLAKSPALRELAVRGAPAALAREILGYRARPAKLTLFDKTPQANWKVPWHQDLTITVRERRAVPGFGPWTVKDGMPHVQPPVWVLEKVVAVRVHLDETPEENGALRVLPGTHRLGRLSEGQIREVRSRTPEAICSVHQGGAMVMSPLLLHASSSAKIPGRHRVLHFEYGAVELPGGLVWSDPA